MFVRKKRNASGSISVQIITKYKGSFKVVRTVGSSKDLEEIKRLYEKAHHCIPDLLRQTTFSFPHPADETIESFLSGVNNLDIRTVGPELIYGRLFDRLGFNAVNDNLFRHLVLARLVYPASKLKTVDYLYRYRGITVEKNAIYRFLDTLNKHYKEQVERIAYAYTKQTLKTITAVFYDLTTLYFETEDEDDLRKIGFSKDGKFQFPQIMLGLLVGSGGYPIGYDIFEGNTFEGTTLIPTLEKIQKKYGFGKPVVVADAALLSKKNLDNLAEKNYRFVIGARIKNETDEMKGQVLERAKNMQDGDSFVLQKQDGTRLVVTYSEKRARKDPD
ncbi:MAG: transposase IS4 family protein [Parcubacteria group bacterium Gr01-1014_66]|nr:MAG: transposase IS4 family protein [Parcubacteria group bacterium Gr01-1014_66]